MAGKKRAEGNVVARLAVQVTPDTEGFRRRLKQRLRVIERQLDELKVDADFREEKLILGAERAARRVKKIVDNIKASVDVKAAEKAVEQIEAKGAELPVGLTTGLAEAQLRKLREKHNNKPVEFKPKLDDSAKRLTWAELKVLSRDRWVKLRPVVDSRAAAVAAETIAGLVGVRLVRDMSQRLWDMVKNLDKAVPLTAAAGSGLAAAAAATVTLSKHVLTVGSGLVHAVQAVGLLAPGLLAGAGVVVASFVVPLRQIADYVPRIRDDFSGLRSDMSSGFWAHALDPFVRGYERVFPQFRDGLELLSRAAGLHSGRLAESLGRILAPRLPEMFEHAARGLDELGAHTNSFATVIGVLGKAGSSGLERFLGWVGRVSDGWADWLTQAERTGRLNRIIDRGVDNLRALGRAGQNAYRMFSGLAKVSERVHGASLVNLADGLGRWADVTNGNGFQETFERILRGARGTWEAFKRQMQGSVSDFFRGVAAGWVRSGALAGEAGGRIGRGLLAVFGSRKVLDGVHEFFKGVRDGLKVLDDRGTWGRASAGLGQVLKFMGSLGRGFSPLVASTVDLFVSAAERLGPVLSRIVEGSGPRLARVLDAAGRVMIPLAEGLARLLELLLKLPGSVELLGAAFLSWRAMSSAATLVSGLRSAVAGLGADLKSLSGFSLFGGMGAAKGGGKYGADAVAAVNAWKTAGDSAARSSSAVAVSVGRMGAVLVGAASAVGLLAAGFVRAEADAERLESAVGRLRPALEAAAEGGGKAVRQLQREMKLARASFRLNEVNEVARNASGLAAVGSQGNLGVGLLAGLTAGAAQWFAGPGSRFKSDLNRYWKGALEDVRKIAETDGVGAIAALQSMGEAAKRSLSGKELELWQAHAREAVKDTGALGAAFERYAQVTGAASDYQARYNLVANETGALLKFARAEQALAANNANALTGALNGQASAWGLTYGKAQGAAKVIADIGPHMLSMAEAARTASGEVASSVGEVIANLERQHEAQVAWADNIVLLAKNGVSDGFLRELSKLPDGQVYVQQMVDSLKEGGNGVDSEFGRWVESIKKFSPALEGAVNDSQGMVQRLVSGTSGEFERLRDSMVGAVGDVQTQVKVAAATNMEELIASLNAGGVRVTQEGQNLLVESGNGFAAVVDLAAGAAGRAADGAVGQVNGRGPVMHGAGIGLAGRFNAGFQSQAPASRAAAEALTSSGMAHMLGSGGAYRSAGSLLGGSTASGIVSRVGSARSAGAAVAGAGAGGARSGSGSFYGAGSSAGAGFVAGIRSWIGAAVEAAASMAAAAYSAARRYLNINSPSRLFRSLGGSVGEGFSLGISDNVGGVRRVARELAASAADATSGVIATTGGLSASASLFHSFEPVGSVPVRVDASALSGATLNLRLSDERELEAYVADVADGRVSELVSVY